MELINANSKLINFQILKKYMNPNKQKGNDGNKSMDFTLTFRSELNFNQTTEKRNKTRKNQRFPDQSEKVKEGKVLLTKNSFSNILDDNPVNLIRQNVCLI